MSTTKQPRIPVSTLAMLLRSASKSDGQTEWRMAERPPLDGSACMLSAFDKAPVRYSEIPVIVVNRRDLCEAALEYVEGFREAKHETIAAQDRAQRMRTVLRSVDRHFRQMGFLEHPCLTDEDRDFIQT